MALLSATEAKALVPKARELSNEALLVYLDAAEQRIVRHARGPVSGDALQVLVPVSLAMPELQLPRPLRNNAKTDVASIARVAETDEAVEADSWYVLRPRTLYRSACWPRGTLRVQYNAVDQTMAAKEAQAHLVAIALIADGIAAIEDGEFVERRLQGVGSESDMISRAERRILGKLIYGLGC